MIRTTGALAALVLATAVASTPAAADQDPGFERALIAAVNQVRAQHRLPPVQADRRLTAAARDFSRELAQRREIAHVGRDGSRVPDRVARQGYAWGYVAENLAANADDALAVVALWMDSPGHRLNLLSPSARHVGAAREIATDPGNPYRTYDVLVLARPL